MKYNVEESNFVDKGSDLEANQIVSHDHKASMGLFEAIGLQQAPAKKESSKLQVSKKTKHDHHPGQKLGFEDKPSDTMDLLITTMNDHELGFKMDTCMLQKHHPRFGEGQQCDEGLFDSSLVMLDEETDEDSTQSLKFGEGQNFQSALATAQKFQKEYKTSEEIPDDKVPESYDFR